MRQAESQITFVAGNWSNHALQRTWRSRSGCNPGIPRAASLRLGCRVAAAAVLLNLAALPAQAALESGAYRVLPGAMVEECGDRVPGECRTLSFAASVTFDLDAEPPLLTALLPNAVLEGGGPFALTVRSSSGTRLADGGYRFSGDYLADLYPSGTQYLFDWRFSTSTNGAVVWNGINGWAGGHLWSVTISNLTVVPQAHLSIARAGVASVQISWATNFSDHLLEYTTSLPAAGWETVTNAVSSAGNRRSVTVEAGGPRRFYRLRQR